MQHLSWQHLSISIYQLLLTWLWPNFKGRFLGLSWTDFNCYGDICSGNICPGDICPYQEYLSWYWPDFDQTLKEGSWDHLEQILTVMVTFVRATFVLAIFVHIFGSFMFFWTLLWNFEYLFSNFRHQVPFLAHCSDFEAYLRNWTISYQF